MAKYKDRNDEAMPHESGAEASSATATATSGAPPAAVPPLEAAASKTADQLMAYLKDSGTAIARLRQLDPWVKANKDASADSLYRHMETVVTQHGTLRKAGKWIWGAEFEPDQLVKMAPADELLRMRSENDQLRARVETLGSEKLSLTYSRDFLKEQNDDLVRKIAYLKIGRTPQELSQVGL